MREMKRMEELKVLVVDDESRMRKLVKDFLNKKGFMVLEAANGEEAIDIFFSDIQASVASAEVICGLIGDDLEIITFTD